MNREILYLRKQIATARVLSRRSFVKGIEHLHFSLRYIKYRLVGFAKLSILYPRFWVFRLLRSRKAYEELFFKDLD